MDTRHLGNRLHSLRSAISRRAILAGLTGGLLAAPSLPIGINDAEARKKQGKRKKKRKSKKQDRPVTRVDATCAGPNDAGLAADGNDRIAQVFTASASGPLVRAELEIKKLEETFGDYLLLLGAVDALAVPTNEVLAATSVANFTVPVGESIVSFTFTNSPSVVAGTQYALIVTRPGSKQLVWLGHDGDTCAGRAFVSPAQTETFLSTSTDLDLNFTAFVRS